MPHKPRKLPLGAAKGTAGKLRALTKRNPRASGKGLKGLARPVRSRPRP